MTALLAGRVDESGYVAYLQRLRTVYATIEMVGRGQAADPCVREVLDPSLERLDALDADLAFWSPAPASAADSPAADNYAERVRASTVWGGLFIAHHYTRYLGDLSGGQVIGRILRREFGLEDNGEGVAFYAFPRIPRRKPYKDAYRARLDGLGLGVEARIRVVDEVKEAFRLNQALLAELDDSAAAHARTPRSF
jgi:heme oxygenase